MKHIIYSKNPKLPGVDPRGFLLGASFKLIRSLQGNSIVTDRDMAMVSSAGMQNMPQRFVNWVASNFGDGRGNIGPEGIRAMQQLVLKQKAQAFNKSITNANKMFKSFVARTGSKKYLSTLGSGDAGFDFSKR